MGKSSISMTMNYQQTIDYLYHRLPMFSRVGVAAYKGDLSNTIHICNALGDPQERFKSIHVAGTNGKGSVSHMLAAILQTAGYKTGLYTSPHLRDFRERIKVDGQMISEKEVIRFTEKVKPLIEEIEPSFFEITVAMAFEHFARHQVDIALIETGLGGRLDSTNIITPVLSIITNISWDHMNILGDSLEKIAVEKSGIIKKEVPVVIGEIIPETKPVFESVALQEKADLTIATDKRKVMDWGWQQHRLVVQVGDSLHPDHKKYELDLPGIYQTKNLLTVLEACSVLKNMEWNIEDEHIHKGLKQVKKLTGLHGRWEIIHPAPLVILDVAHNVGGISQLVQQIEVTDHHQLHIILGMVKDKEVEKVLELLPIEGIYYFTQAQVPRALPAEVLSSKAEKAKLRGEPFADVNTALKSALFKAGKDDLIIICGSVFLIGEVNIPIH